MKINKSLMICMIFLVSLVYLVYATNYVVISELGINPSYQGDDTDDGKEFIELYNPINSTVNIGSWNITFKGRPSASNVVIPSASLIQANGYYLIADSGGYGWPSNWSNPDFFDNFQLTNLNFGIRLLDNSGNLVDAVGWGDLLLYPNYYETETLSNPINGHSYERKPGYLNANCGNWQDTGNNSNDFLDNPNPEPQNSSFSEIPCKQNAECTADNDCSNLNTACADGFCNLQTGQCEQIFKSSATQCRAAMGSCDVAEYCTGQNAACPADLKAPQGTSCGEARDCPDDKCRGYFAEFYPADGHDKCDGQGSCIVYSCDLEDKYCSDNNPNDGVNILECGAPCDQDSDCDDQNPETIDICGSDCSCVLEKEQYCGDGKEEPGEECDDGNIINGDGCDRECKIETELYLAPYVGDIDGSIDSDWFFFYNQLREWHENNSIPVGLSFYPDTMNDPQFNQIIADIYFSEYIELITKGEEQYNGTPLELMPYAQVKTVIEAWQSRFIKELEELGYSDIQTPVSYNQLMGRFTNTIRDVIHELGFKIYFEQYASEYGYIEGLPALDVMQYSVSFTASGQAGADEVFKQPENILKEVLTFEHDHMLYINGTKVVSLLSHQQDFRASEESSALEQQKWEIYTTLLLMAKNDARIHLLRPEEIYDLRHPSKFVCGNGILEPEEECDDGNKIDSDGCSSNCKNMFIDDLQVNYLRGKIRIDGLSAPEGTPYKAEILSGNNVGEVYEGIVDDENIPQFLKGNGFFDTRDQITFTTASMFRITSGACNGGYEGGFLGGGNGDFNDENTLISFNCIVPPIIQNVYHSPSQPTEIDDIHIFANVTDNFGVDKVIVNYSINSSNANLMEMDCNGICSANLGAFGFGSVIGYNIAANDTYGNYVVSYSYIIIVGAADRDGDNYKSDIDCDDNNAGINPGAIEVCDGLDNNCNSLIDEYLGQTTCGVGMCEHTIDNCFNGELQICNPFEGADIEICDGLDNDCDGLIEDDGIDEVWYNQPTNCGVGECSSIGVYTCGNGLQIDTCLAGTPTDEICDGLDNDCNSLIDEGFTDTDNDNESDCVDEDDDNDGILDEDDDYPLDPNRFAVMDVSGDGVVNTLDLILTRRQFGKTPNDPDWNNIYDVSRDKRINTLDLILIRRAFT